MGSSLWPLLLPKHILVFIDQEDILIPVQPTAVPIPVHPMAVPIPVHPTVHPMEVPIPVHPTAVPTPVHPTKFIKANDLLSQNLQNIIARLYMTLYMKKNAKPSTSKSAILNTRKSAIRSPPHIGMGLISPSANISQWKNAKMFPKQNATMFPRMNAKMCPNK